MKKFRCAVGALALATSLSLIGCNEKTYEVKELEYELVNKNKPKKEVTYGYKAEDVHVIKVLNPLTDKITCYFMKCYYDNLDADSCYPDRKSEIIQSLNLGDLDPSITFIVCPFQTYNTIFDDGNYFINHTYYISYQGDDKLEYVITKQQLETRDFHSYVTLKSEKNTDNINEVFKASYCMYNNDYLYQTTEEKYAIEDITFAEFYNCDPEDVFDITELKEICEDANRSYEVIAQKPKTMDR